jgi:hypothetical protein
MKSNRTFKKYRLVWVISFGTVLGGGWLAYQYLSRENGNLRRKAASILQVVKEKGITQGDLVKGQNFDFKYRATENQEKLSKLQTEYQDVLSQFDRLENRYTISNTKYLHLLKSSDGDPENAALKEAFRESQDILNEMSSVGEKIKELALDLQNTYLELEG